MISQRNNGNIAQSVSEYTLRQIKRNVCTHFLCALYIYYSMKLQDIPARVHFVGVGGIGMSALAQYLHKCGHTVTGSDRTQNEQTKALANIGVRVYTGHNKYNVDGAELVVHTSAVHEDNVELQEAKHRHIPIILREQLLGTVFNSFNTRIAVCGTHGKTTVTAMIHRMLQYCGVSHSAFIGGLYCGNNFYFGTNVVVAEACEYNRSFFNLKPTITVCTNAEYDHPDCYDSEAAVRRAFKRFIANTSANGVAVLPCSLANLGKGRRCVLYDTALSGEITVAQGKPSFTANYGKRQVNIRLSIVGRHNAYNALAALAVGRELRLPLDDCVSALSSFCGVERRWTEKDVNGVRVVLDYAHHPTEIACSVATAASVAQGRVLCVFQPHTYSRTKAFFKQFALCFAYADEVAYLPVYSAREKPIAGVDSQRLTGIAVKNKIKARFFPDFHTVSKWIKQTAKAGDVVLVLGAGDVVELGKLL